MDQVRNVISRAIAGDAESILLVFAIYTLLMCAYSIWYQLRLQAWPETRGKLINRGLAHVAGFEWDPGDKLYATDALYEYQVDGQTYQGQKISPWVMVASHNVRSVLWKQLSRLEVGPENTVSIYYNPQKPAQAILIKPGNIGIAITVCIALLPLVLYFTF